MSSDFDDRVRDVAVWFVGNKKRIPRENLLKRIEFLEKAISCLIENQAIAARDLMDLEKRPLRNKLWLPTEVSIDGQPPIQLR